MHSAVNQTNCMHERTEYISWNAIFYSFGCARACVSFGWDVYFYWRSNPFAVQHFTALTHWHIHFFFLLSFHRLFADRNWWDIPTQTEAWKKYAIHMNVICESGMIVCTTSSWNVWCAERRYVTNWRTNAVVMPIFGGVCVTSTPTPLIHSHLSYILERSLSLRSTRMIVNVDAAFPSPTNHPLYHPTIMPQHQFYCQIFSARYHFG